MRILESTRLLIRPVEESDLKDLLELRWNNEVMQYLVHEPINQKEQMDWFKNLSSKKNLACSIFLKPNLDKLIGTVGLYEFDSRHQRAVWRVRLTPEVQGQGIGFESTAMMLHYGFNTLNLKKICSNSMADNSAIRKMTLKLGFKEEGLFKSHFYFNGSFHDAVFFGLLKEDFYAMEYVKKLFKSS